MNQDACVCSYCLKWGIVSLLEDFAINDEWAICLLCGSTHAHTMEPLKG